MNGTVDADNYVHRLTQKLVNLLLAGAAAVARAV
jgi:hypothetical protein